MLLQGLCEILTSFFLIISISLSFNHTQCPHKTSGPKNPIESKYSNGLNPFSLETSLISFWVSLTWIWIFMSFSSANLRTSFNNSSEAVYGEWGPKNTLILPSAASWQFLNRAILFSISAFLFSSSPKSIIPYDNTALIPDSSTAFATSSI